MQISSKSWPLNLRRSSAAGSGWLSVARRVAAIAALTIAGLPLCTADEPLEYNRDIRPILADNCFACHGADSAARKADLRLDQRDAAVDSRTIVPEQPGESELIARILSDDPDTIMPPPATKKTLTQRQKNMLSLWITQGAEYQKHWSFIAPVQAVPPTVNNATWPRNDIDRFILQKLEHSGLTPAPEADPHTLFRRLHLDITGLPPVPADIAAFTSDYQQRGDAALSDWIDRLMLSERWGEHRARYWLDAARYGDTHGLHFDNYREMWPYRDWVIRAFNSNQPFDQFTVEQIAGDLLPAPTDDQLIATGFQRCNITTNEGGTIDEENVATYAADRVQTLGWVYLGLTTNCCQCHDHKFDPITMKDYYSLAAFFRNTTQQAKDGNVKDGRGPVLIVPLEQDKERWKALPAEIAAAQASRNERRNNAKTDFDAWLTTATSASLTGELPGNGLLLQVPLNEGAGNEVHGTAANLATASGTGEAGVRSSEVFRSNGDATWVPDGKFGPASVVKASGNFELGEHGDFARDQPFSCAAWIRTGRNGVFGSIVARMDDQNMYRGWDVWQNDRSLAMHIVDSWPDNAVKVVTNDAVLKPGEWQHITVAYDGSGTPQGIHIYVDGDEKKLRIEKNTLQPAADIGTTTSLRIGQRSTGQIFDGGSVQDFRLYDRALVTGEAKALAEIGPLRAILDIAAEQRTPEQQASLYDHFLTTLDAQYPLLAKTAADLEAERAAIEARSPVTHIQRERMDSPAMANILLRGAYDAPGEQVTATTPTSLHAMPPDAPANRSGLATWLTDPANPLTARVTVNRFWQQIFGTGIVATPEDFGVMGALPTHPELLDWLAVDFRNNGWDVKRFFKQILMSATYRQAGTVTPEKLESDRDNALLSRGPRFRMDAEMVRDYALAAGGLLSPKMYGPGVKPYQPGNIWDMVGLPGGDTRNYVQSTGEDLYRRTLYTFWKRMAPPPNLEAFNAPSREVCTVRRERTNTPLQALVTLNDPQFVEAARSLAQNALRSSGSDAEVLNVIADRTLCRKLNSQEQIILQNDHAQFLEYYRSKPDDAKALISVGESKADESIDAAALAAWTMVCNQVLNLDEVLNK